MRVKVNGRAVHSEGDGEVVAGDTEVPRFIRRVVRDHKAGMADLVRINEAHGKTGTVPENLVKTKDQSVASRRIRKSSRGINNGNIGEGLIVSGVRGNITEIAGVLV